VNEKEKEKVRQKKEKKKRDGESEHRAHGTTSVVVCFVGVRTTSETSPSCRERVEQPMSF